MENMQSIIRRHNAKILKPNTVQSTKECNCRKIDHCPLEGKCLTSNIVYQAVVSAEGMNDKTYIGMTEHEFKIRFRNHKMSLNNKNYSKSTALSKYAWELKETGKPFSIKWSILKRARAYRSGAKKCNLCLAEKMLILNGEKEHLLNKRTEILAKCRHTNKYCATNFKPP